MLKYRWLIKHLKCGFKPVTRWRIAKSKSQEVITQKATMSLLPSQRPWGQETEERLIVALIWVLNSCFSVSAVGGNKTARAQCQRSMTCLSCLWLSPCWNLTIFISYDFLSLKKDVQKNHMDSILQFIYKDMPIIYRQCRRITTV